MKTSLKDLLGLTLVDDEYFCTVILKEEEHFQSDPIIYGQAHVLYVGSKDPLEGVWFDHYKPTVWYERSQFCKF